MGWFDEQIRSRKLSDDEAFAESFADIAGAVLGPKAAAAFRDGRRAARDAIEEILRFYRVDSRPLPPELKTTDEQLEYLLRPHGIMRRTVKLSPGWHRDAVGAMLGVRRSDGGIVALVPGPFGGYSFLERESGRRVRVTSANEKLFEEDAVAFCVPFPPKKLGLGELVRYILRSLTAGDFVLFAAVTLVITLVGLLPAKLNNIIFSEIVVSGSARVIIAMGVFLLCVNVSTLIFGVIKSMLLTRVNAKMDASVSAAAMMRIISLPADFFRGFASGELAERAQNISALCDQMVNVLLSAGLTGVFSLVYIAQIFAYAPALTGPALGIILATVLFSAVSAFVQMRLSRRSMELDAKERGMSYALIAGVQKIKLAGAEKRAFSRWARLFAQGAAVTYNPPLFIKLNGVIMTAITLAGTIIMYYGAVKSGVTVADYYAFTGAYGMVSGAFSSLAGIALTAAQFKPIYELARPILETVPETGEDREIVTRLSGGIELSHVTFRYTETMPPVLNNLSLKIRPGQYVAIVGPTGCGKSTLLRLLLGFETPQKGAVYYDGRDISRLDLKSLRRKMGVVMQDGKLFRGDIYSNIAGDAPGLSMDEAWEAAETAGLAEDIRQMPMGMFTMLSEGGAGISGGQRQRLMIARAVAGKPHILMFDEATSALDNITQKHVSEALDALKCTRIVIAHRLSTIRRCDRILYLEGGRIAEDGSYDELMALKGKFASLVERQQLDPGAK